MRSTLLVLHIIAVGAWLGASITAVFLSTTAKSRGIAAWKEFISGFEEMDKRLFPAAGVAVAITGAGLVLESSVYEFGHAFVLIGIVVVITGIALGVGIFGPMARRITSGETEEAGMDAVYRRFSAFGTLDIALLVVAISVMVAKAGV